MSAQRDATLVNGILSTADPGLNSPQTQNGSIQDIEDINRQSHTIYHIHCETAYVDSYNTHNVAMENCGNHAPQVTYHRPKIIRSEKRNKILHSQSLDIGSQTSTRTSFSVEYVMLFSASLLVISCLVAIIMNLPQLCERM